MPLPAAVSVNVSEATLSLVRVIVSLTGTESSAMRLGAARAVNRGSRSIFLMIVWEVFRFTAEESRA